MDTYTDRINHATKRANVSPKQLAAALELSIQAITKVMEGKTTAFTAYNNAKAAKFLGVSSDWLATGEADAVQEAFSNWPFSRIALNEMKGLPPKYLEIVENLALSMLDLSQNVAEPQEDKRASGTPQGTFTVHTGEQRGVGSDGKSNSDEGERPRDQRPAGGRT